NFLLDGIENNNTLVTGPATFVASEAVEEYRVSTSNYSAEFGRAAGFVANAVTRFGGNTLHGVAYGFLNHDALNAASFLHNAGYNTAVGRFQDQVPELQGTVLSKQPQRELYAGFWAGGPVRRDRTFWSAAFEQFRSRSRQDAAPYLVPIPDRIQATQPNAPGLNLLEKYRPPAAVPLANGSGLTGIAVLGTEAALDR